MKKRILAVMAALALLLPAGCGDKNTQTQAAEEAAPTATACPVKIGLYGVTSLTAVTGPGESEEVEPDGDVLCLRGSGDGSLTQNGRPISMEWTCSGDDFAMTLNGQSYTGTVSEGGTVITLALSDGEHEFTFGAESTAETAEADPDEDPDEDGEAAETGSETESEDAAEEPADPDENNIFGADEPDVIEDDTPTEDYITLGTYGAVSCTDESGRTRVIDGDEIILHTAENDPAEDILVNGQGTFQRWDSFILFRYDLKTDGTFTGYWCWSGPDEFTGDFHEEIITGTYDGTTLAVTVNGLQYEFVLDETPQQADDYQYTADNYYGDSFAVRWGQ